MSSLDKIQKLSKLGKILCSIVFVFCVIGIILTGKSKSIVEKRTINKIELWKRGK